jgi:hypothetical protein
MQSAAPREFSNRRIIFYRNVGVHVYGTFISQITAAKAANSVRV